MNKQDAPTRRWIDRVPRAWFVAGAGLFACLVTLYFFCPRFYIWRGIVLGIPELASYPEINRALVVLEQLKRPDIRIESPSNNVVEWRLFFPFVGHKLGLSPVVFLSLTFVGCWAAASFIVAVMLRELGDRFQAFWATLLACGSAWFFVSTAWLTYNDSWVVLALAVVAFTRSRPALAITCLLVSWIDERFLLVLPTAIALRTFIQPRDEQAHDEQWLRTFGLDLATAIGASAPFVLIRVAAYFNGTDPHTVAYLHARTTETFPLSRYLEGAWAGLRCNWVYVGVWIWLAARTKPLWWSAVAILGTLFSLVVVLKSAGDLHRSAAMFVVVGLAGIVMLHRARPAINAKLLPVLALVGLILPAAHVITVFKIPIYGAFDEWSRSEQDLPQRLRPEYYNELAMRYTQANRLDQALTYFDYALRLDPTSPITTLNKAVMLTNTSRHVDAIALLNSVLAQNPNWPDAAYLRGNAREKSGDKVGAAADYDHALKHASPEWERRAEVEQKRQRLRDAGISP